MSYSLGSKPSTVSLVRVSILVHTATVRSRSGEIAIPASASTLLDFSFSFLWYWINRDRQSPYFFPRADNGASPPIRSVKEKNIPRCQPSELLSPTCFVLAVSCSHINNLVVWVVLTNLSNDIIDTFAMACQPDAPRRQVKVHQVKDTLSRQISLDVVCNDLVKHIIKE